MYTISISDGLLLVLIFDNVGLSWFVNEFLYRGTYLNFCDYSAQLIH